ncbi:MAG: hypothetical protein RBR81_02025 [Bacteroidales bacterium]|jgi:hypothetical protein|nr:hypothetical protein [Bacteroidales bacterium]
MVIPAKKSSSVLNIPLPCSLRGIMAGHNLSLSYEKKSRLQNTRIVLVVLIFILIQARAFAQEKPGAISFRGYLTTMQSSMFDSISGPFLNENLLHNRLNFKGYVNDNITLAAEFRNRLFTGDLVRLGSYYPEIIGADDGIIDMSWNVLEKQSFLFNTTVDRLWLDLRFEKFQATIGRQRINWGQALVWNPNDIFNAYSFFDFDYMERPGSDAVRLQYFPASSSSVEIAVKADSENDVTAAGLYRFNRWGYDIQFLAGFVNGRDIVIGAGWSGEIGNNSFRGEASWFDGYEDFPGDESVVLLTAGLDRIFQDNSMAQVQLMYCNNPLDLIDFNSFYSGNLSSRDLAFSRFTAFGQYTWAVNPLLNLTASAMWFPDLEGYFAGPSLDYSLFENLDFSLIWQHFNAIIGGEKSRMNLGFLRLKYSF